MTEVLCCTPCLKAHRSGESGPMGRWLAWDDAILHQLSEAHRSMFPAILTARRGVDRGVLLLLRDRTEGNTMSKVWRQVQENHLEDYNHRRDLYTTLPWCSLETLCLRSDTGSFRSLLLRGSCLVHGCSATHSSWLRQKMYRTTGVRSCRHLAVC